MIFCSHSGNLLKLIILDLNNALEKLMHFEETVFNKRSLDLFHEYFSFVNFDTSMAFTARCVSR